MSMKRARTMAFPMLIAALALVAGPLWAAQAKAPTAPVTARDVVVQTTHRVMTIISKAQKYFDKDPERFYRQIRKVLDDVVDFDSFARGVMGKYASREMYMSLHTKAEKRAFVARMRRFSDTFREALVRTYAKGLLAFNGNRIEILPETEKEVPGKSVTIVQRIYGDAEKPYVVHYKMRRNHEGQWKLRNVTIEAINLGKVYQSQFASAAKLYHGDIDKVIDNWTVDPTADHELEANLHHPKAG